MAIESIIMAVVGAGLGGVIGWLIKLIKDKLKIAELENKNYKLQMELNELTTKMAKTIEELKKTQTLLTDSLAAIELLKAYKAIDDETKRKIDELKGLMKDGKSTPESIEKYKAMIDEINKKNQAYNKGEKYTTPPIPTTPTVPPTPNK